MKELVEYVARSLVSYPDELVVTEQRSADVVVLHLRVRPDDMGKVIGRQGRVAQAIRTLLKVAATRQNRRAILQIG